MRAITSGIFIATLLVFATSCSQADRDKTDAQAERAAHKAEAAAKRLEDKTKQAASEISDKTKSAVNDSGAASSSAEGKLRNGADQVQATGERASKGLKESAMTAAVKSKLASQVGLDSATDISVETVGHTVTLTGKVESDEKRNDAEKTALTVDGVTKVNNRLVVR